MNRVTSPITVEQNTLKRRGVGLRACDPERACPGYTLFAPCFEQNRTVYLVDLQGEVIHTWQMPYAPGLSGYLTERGTLIYNGRTLEEGFLSRFPFKGGRFSKPTGAAKFSGRCITATIITMGSCSATAMCC
jgi:hypothetical protein